MSETAKPNSSTPDLRIFAFVVGAVCATGLLVQLAALKFAAPTPGTSTVVTDAQVVTNPNDPMNAVGYTLYIAAAGVALLLLKKLPVSGLLEYLAALLVWDLTAITAMHFAGLEPLTAAVVGGVFTLVYLRYHPWWLINLCAVAFGAYAAAVLGRNFGLLPAIVLLAATALFDYVAVFRTGHMVSIAQVVKEIDIPLPAVLVVPTGWAFFDGDADLFNDDDAVTIGLGDVVIPAVLVVSAGVWASTGGVELMGVMVPWPALGAIVGVMAGNAGVLYVLLCTDRALPGLPFINTGAVLGFVVGFLPVVVA